MVKVKAPNKEYTGITATVPFIRGVGETSDERLIDWFRKHGYAVEEVIEPVIQQASEPEPEVVVDFEAMTVEELKAFAEDNEIDLGRSSSKESILKKIMGATESVEE